MASQIKFGSVAQQYAQRLTASSQFHRTSSVSGDNTLAESSIRNNDSSFDSTFNRYHSIMNTDSSNIEKAFSKMKNTDFGLQNQAKLIGM